MLNVAQYSTMPNVLFFPPLPDRAHLLDQLFRSIWHFLPALNKLGKLVFPYSGEDFPLLNISQILSMARVYLDRDFDPAIADYAALYEGKIELIEARDLSLSNIGAEDIQDLKGVIVWNAGNEHIVAAAKRIAAKTGAELIWADPSTVHQETLATIRFVYQLFEQCELEQLVHQSYGVFRKNIPRWKGRRVSAFGNGPSLGQVVKSKVNLGSTLRAVCNSTISDAAALQYLNPELLFCGDPVQHCGPSLYAGQFRQDLARAMHDSSRILITQLGYVPYFRHVVSSDAHDRIVGIGNDRRAKFNIDLEKEFITSSTANIFTMLVLPVTLTLSADVEIYGCDGMSFLAAGKPWAHAGEEEYMGKMAVTHRVHPGFWKRNYEEEFWSYCNDMEEIVSQAEKKGSIVRSITPSYVPALAKRHVSA
jgi:hypothetical protein